MAMKVNQRTCIFSKKKYPKNELVRFVIINDELIFDLNHYRGYYLKIQKNMNLEKLYQFLKKRFMIKNEEQVYQILKQLIQSLI
ncbi:YlxR family protein [Ureaplasma urealyticum]|uniref:YlxR family protein n=3 Tax=Ureaplasma urealyticum TaxID=2130 RepID=A0AAP9D7C8_UREUR|nr:YlxR family protein [Ureaplasma urealyticum]EDX53914.1 conserved hypothetical protein [Ureaplasma urealyticum serovar 9 str. ATCC 33175]ACI60152.1 conserved hypothetical protein [Ureaplasma urealyticum serovar 10 str. ATCC 33699]EDT49295.1 conserved hypothetical protein [Ureaplasma urealyticum serovar 13 str. ATCC 33698]EDU05971.1 conserved hypothetical protein [Ureaplasma urealyticum serovar 5 str. ATCC 27817]EDU57027.1 conserved hypothetical protein [Ureaplasma urealyticum serovar 7 str. 